MHRLACGSPSRWHPSQRPHGEFTPPSSRCRAERPDCHPGGPDVSTLALYRVASVLSPLDSTQVGVRLRLRCSFAYEPPYERRRPKAPGLGELPRGGLVYSCRRDSFRPGSPPRGGSGAAGPRARLTTSSKCRVERPEAAPAAPPRRDFFVYSWRRDSVSTRISTQVGSDAAGKAPARRWWPSGPGICHGAPPACGPRYAAGWVEGNLAIEGPFPPPSGAPPPSSPPPARPQRHCGLRLAAG